MTTLVVNLFGAPSAGKSTLAAGVFSALKHKGVNCELVQEFAKDLVWEGSIAPLNHQLYVFAQQWWRMKRLEGKVDVIVTDSPLLLSLFYDKSNCPILHALISKEANSFKSLNFFVNRTKTYNPKGRLQTEEESDEIRETLLKLLESNTNLIHVLGNKEGEEYIIEKTWKELNF